MDRAYPHESVCNGCLVSQLSADCRDESLAATARELSQGRWRKGERIHKSVPWGQSLKRYRRRGELQPFVVRRKVKENLPYFFMGRVNQNRICDCKYTRGGERRHSHVTCKSVEASRRAQVGFLWDSGGGRRKVFKFGLFVRPNNAWHSITAWEERVPGHEARPRIGDNRLRAGR